MKTIILSSFAIIIALVMTAPAWASTAPTAAAVPTQITSHHISSGKIKVHRAHHKSDVAVWCGGHDANERARFPYLTAVHNVTKHGVRFQVATVYRKGRVVLRQYVFKSHKANQVTYESSGDGFSLTLNDNGHLTTEGGFKAVIEDKDGDTFVANGAMACYRGQNS